MSITKQSITKQSEFKKARDVKAINVFNFALSNSNPIGDGIAFNSIRYPKKISKKQEISKEQFGSLLAEAARREYT